VPRGDVVFAVLAGTSALGPLRSAAILSIVGAAVLAGVYAYQRPEHTAPEPRDPQDHATVSPRDQWTAQARDKSPHRRVDVDELARELIDRGRASLADGDFRAGFEAYRLAAEYSPTAETHGLIGDLYLRAAATSEAAFHLRRAADLDPGNADRWLALANVYILKTDLGAAWKAIDRAKQVEPGIIVERDDNNFVVRGGTG